MSRTIRIRRPGKLRRLTHTPKGERIPVAKLRALKARAKRTHDVELEREANFALVARGWKRAKRR